ncbi:hypothetical protein NFIA_009090 [Paecilomyces variotii No. 5]|uniref:Uncharacterized protein n=1 Tax=Byssochlamys spectabilis (strain No. 5 / NBRC 109023) TaxID=1356009 RepID=V5I5A2_BYSSN|nr:hypothetical protein NFIA_009090 [Paecilomyces variotii No. 5]
MASTPNLISPPPPPAPQEITRKTRKTDTSSSVPEPPLVPSTGPTGAFLVEQLIYNGAPFKDHWAYYVGSHDEPDIGVKIHATEDVRNGFKFEIKRSENLRTSEDVPTKRIPLQWVDGKRFNGETMLNNGVYKVDDYPICGLEASACKVKAPAKSLNAIDASDTQTSNIGKKIEQRHCQTWIVESAAQLAKDGLFSKEVVDYLHAVKQ